MRAAVDLTRQLRSGRCVCFGLVDDDLDLLLLFRVQNLREAFVKLWLLLLHLCAPTMLEKGRTRGTWDAVEVMTIS